MKGGVGCGAMKTKKTTQSKRRATITQSISFDWEVYELMETERKKTRIETPRSAFIREALEEKFQRAGLLPKLKN